MIMNSLNKIELLIQKKGEVSTKDIANHLSISQQHATRLFNAMPTYGKVVVVKRVVRVNNRDFLIKHLKLRSNV